MSESEETSPDPVATEEGAPAEVAVESPTPESEVDVAAEEDSPSAGLDVKTPEFEELATTRSESGASIDRFYDVSVSISAELGRVSMSLGELMRIGEGAVIKLDRPVSAPVELMAQGVRVALGEVVVVDDCFAVRIREIETKRKP